MADNIPRAIYGAVSEGPIDTVAVFIAGHGQPDKNGNYYQGLREALNFPFREPRISVTIRNSITQ